jgi:putative acetyltransferase
VVLLSIDGKTVSCGAFKKLDEETVEIKRMWTLPDYRGKGCASTVLGELEHWAREEGYTNSMLETGRRMQDAIKLYLQNEYAETEKLWPVHRGGKQHLF